VRQHPHIHYGDSSRRGYAVLDVTAERCVLRMRVVGDVESRRTGVGTAASFRVDAGRPGVSRL